MGADTGLTGRVAARAVFGQQALTTFQRGGAVLRRNRGHRQRARCQHGRKEMMRMAETHASYLGSTTTSRIASSNALPSGGFSTIGTAAVTARERRDASWGLVDSLAG